MRLHTTILHISWYIFNWNLWAPSVFRDHPPPQQSRVPQKIMKCVQPAHAPGVGPGRRGRPSSCGSSSLAWSCHAGPLSCSPAPARTVSKTNRLVRGAVSVSVCTDTALSRRKGGRQGTYLLTVTPETRLRPTVGEPEGDSTGAGTRPDFRTQCL